MDSLPVIKASHPVYIYIFIRSLYVWQSRK